MATRINEANRRPIAAAVGAIAITPSDSTVLSPICQKIYLGNETAANTVKVRLVDGSQATFTLAAGTTVLDIQFDMVYSTGTTLANNPVGLYMVE
jgi:hypothetical protein